MPALPFGALPRITNASAQRDRPRNEPVSCFAAIASQASASTATVLLTLSHKYAAERTAERNAPFYETRDAVASVDPLPAQKTPDGARHDIQRNFAAARGRLDKDAEAAGEAAEENTPLRSVPELVAYALAENG